MSDQAFNRLAPFIQQYIYRHEWEELRGIQARAITAILDGSEHVLIASGTASGKTEAAFFPILSQLSDTPSNSFGVLYIGPLKALINDQFERITGLLDEADMPIFAWHGDRGQGEKARAVKESRGVLQITPESLEALLMNRPGDVKRMFYDLRFVVIDEVHAFMGQDRGTQLLCQLNRVDRLIGTIPRRIGLSATINDYESACEWLSGGTKLATQLVVGQSGGRKLNLGMAHFHYDSDVDANLKDDYYDFLYKLVRGRKCLIFTNSRSDSEEVTARMRDEASKHGEPDIFHVHHGSLSSAIRSETERALRDAQGPAVAAATKTLELGIDLGGLERVVQLGAPGSCSSFVQRLGRAGRRGQPAQMRFITKNETEGAKDVFQLIPWDLIQNIAIIQLYLEERWVEPFQNKPYPFSLLFHQTLSALSSSEKTPAQLARAVLSLPPFERVTQEDYKTLLRHMLETDMIERMEDGKLIVGLEGERQTNSYRFYSVFQDDRGYRVLSMEREIGTIDTLPEVGAILLMAGRRWTVDDIDTRRGCVYVKPAQSHKKTIWTGGGASVDDKIIRRMRQVLIDDAQYGYLHQNAADALEYARETARKAGILDGLTSGDGKRFYLHPWLGTRKSSTLHLLLGGVLKQPLGVFEASLKRQCCCFQIQSENTPDVFITKLRDALENLSIDNVDVPEQFLISDRYDPFVPKELLEKAYRYNILDLDGLKGSLFAEDWN